MCGVTWQRLRPEAAPTVVMRPQGVETVDCVCELGCFSVMLANGTEEERNEYAGYLLRSKVHWGFIVNPQRATADEGGIASGVSAADSLLLTRGE